jgi:hypothetical protein
MSAAHAIRMDGPFGGGGGASAAGATGAGNGGLWALAVCTCIADITKIAAPISAKLMDRYFMSFLLTARVSYGILELNAARREFLQSSPFDASARLPSAMPRAVNASVAQEPGTCYRQRSPVKSLDAQFAEQQSAAAHVRSGSRTTDLR